MGDRGVEKELEQGLGCRSKRRGKTNQPIVRGGRESRLKNVTHAWTSAWTGWWNEMSGGAGGCLGPTPGAR